MMNTPRSCLLYYSHSWLSKDVDFNRIIWERISNRCQLLVDRTEKLYPDYHISRIEDYIRRCDAFLAVFLADAPSKSEVEPQSINKNTKDTCTASPYALFELRLAERADKPRLILYDRDVQFPLPRVGDQSVRYHQFNRDDLGDHNNAVWVVIEDWLETIAQSGKGESIVDQNAALLLSEEFSRSQEGEAVRDALIASGFTNVNDLTKTSTDAEITAVVCQSRVLVADVSCQSLWDIYGMTHALFIPTIRLSQEKAAFKINSLPHILRGYATAGYEDDLVRWSSMEELKSAVTDRATEILTAAAPITDRNIGRAFFERRR